jgi:hypothetical protein
MPDYVLTTDKAVKKSKALKSNIKAVRKLEKRIKLFDFRTKLYKLFHLKSKELFDTTEENFSGAKQAALLAWAAAVFLQAKR